MRPGEGDHRKRLAGGEYFQSLVTALQNQESSQIQGLMCNN